MSKIGLALLYFWIGFNALLALSIVASMFFLHANAPALIILFDESSIKTITPDALRTINALAILLNATIAAFCCLALVLIWKGFLQQKWVFASLGLSLSFIQIMGFVSDHYLKNKNVLANIVSTMILVSGLLLSSQILRKKRKTKRL